MSPKFFYRYCIACKKGIFLLQKMTIFQFLEPGRQKDRFFTGFTIMIKNFGDIPPRPKFFEESDGATRFSIGPRPLGLKNGFLKGISKKSML